MKLEGRSAIVTGGSGGLGAAIARKLAWEGAAVLVTDVLEDEGRAVASEIGGTFLAHDVSNPEAWTEAVELVEANFGKLDILVNNAGLSGAVGQDIMALDEYDRLLSVNSRGVFLGMRAAIPAMQSAGHGAIVNMSSVSGITGQYGLHLGYNASKGAVRLMTKAAAVNYARHGIRVNSVHPGLMPPMRSAVAMADPTLRGRMLDHVPMGREGEVDEVANAVLFLVSDDASYITGAELHVDGGYSAY